jgi:hypothetical protein
MTLAYAEAAYRLREELSATEVAVLAALGAAANSEGHCWHRRSLIASRVRLHPDTVKTVLQALARKGLIEKVERRRDDGSQASNVIALKFAPADMTPAKGGDTPPTRGSTTPPRSHQPGAQDPGGPGVDDPPHEESEEASKRNPLKSPKGDVSPSIREWAKRIWAAAPRQARQRSGADDVERSLNAAVVERGADPADILAALTAYWQDVGSRDRGQFLKGVHVMLRQDRWREWMPEGDDDDSGADAAGAAREARPAQPQVPPEVMAAHLQRVWRERVSEFKRVGVWKVVDYGPPPVSPACKAPREILTEFGFDPKWPADVLAPPA